MPILISDGKEVEKRYTADGKNVRTVYNANGDIVFEEIDTAEGTLPQSFKSKGKPLINYCIYGNTIQNGTPTPENLVEVQGCGVRTENILEMPEEMFDANNWIICPKISGTSYFMAYKLPDEILEKLKQNIYICYAFLIGSQPGNGHPIIISDVVSSKYDETSQRAVQSNGTITGSIIDASDWDAAYLILGHGTGIREIIKQEVINSLLRQYKLTLTKGSNPPTSYIPYGYKLDIISTNALENTSATTPVYIGQSPLYKIGDYADYVDFKRGGIVRKIKELVLTGDEDWKFIKLNIFDVAEVLADINLREAYCTHFKTVSNASTTDKSISCGTNETNKRNLCVRYDLYNPSQGDIYNNPPADFKAFLATQYAAGTPVKVYYVLATPEFEPVSDLSKIPTFAPQTVLDTDMTIKPSKMWYKYKPQSYLEYFKSLRTGAKYQVKIPKFAYDTTADCIKQLDNAGLVAEPSTDAVEGRDDYLDIPVFKWWHCNYRRDSKGQAIITALEGDPEYSTTGTADVGSLFMSRYRKWEEFEEYSLLTISDSPHVPEVGWELMDVCKDENGEDKGYGIFSAYHGLYSQPNVAPLLFISHNSALTAYQAKGAGYWGQDDERLQFIYDNIMLKYATKSSQTVFKGCTSYNYQYDAAYKDSTAHTYFPLTAAQAANIEVGSAVCVGYASLNTLTGALNKDRGQATVRSKIASAKVLKKETVTLDGVDYVGVYLDIPAEQAFDTLDTDVSTATYPDTYSPAMLSTMPWRSGSTDAVIGKRDGSLSSNTDSKHPFRIMGIEAQIGAWDAVCDTVMRINADYSTDFFQAPKGVAHSTSESTIAGTYTIIGTMDKDVGGSTSFWVGDVTSPNGTFYPSTRGNGDSKGCGDYCYRSASAGWREVLRGGSLTDGSRAGCCFLHCYAGLAIAAWAFAAAD